MIELPDLLTAIAAQLKDQIGLRADDYVPEKVNPPAAFLALTSLTEGSFGAGSFDVGLDVVVLVSSNDAKTGQRLLYQYLSATGTKSVVNAITHDPTFGLTGVSSHFGSFRFLGIEEIAAYGFFGCALPLACSIS